MRRLSAQIVGIEIPEVPEQEREELGFAMLALWLHRREHLGYQGIPVGVVLRKNGTVQHPSPLMVFN